VTDRLLGITGMKSSVIFSKPKKATEKKQQSRYFPKDHSIKKELIYPFDSMYTCTIIRGGLDES
jgi:hypothetical protein